MVRVFRSQLIAFGLNLILGTAVLASCAKLSSEEAERLFNQDLISNSYPKYFLITIIVLALANLITLIIAKRLWFALSLLSASVVVFAVYIFAEIIGSECGYRGIDYTYYLLPASALVLLLVAQRVAKPSSRL